MNARDAPVAASAATPQRDEARDGHVPQDIHATIAVPYTAGQASPEASALSDVEMKVDVGGCPGGAESASEATPVASPGGTTVHRRRKRHARPSQPLLAAGPPIHKAAAAASATPPTAPPVALAASAPAPSRAPESVNFQTPRTDAAEAVADMKQLGLAVEEDEEDLASYNNDICDTCGGHGRFLCCDGCPRSFHFACTNPPLDTDEMPFPNGTLLSKPTSQDPRLRGHATADDSWFCRVCFSAQRKPRIPPGVGPFGPLLAQLECENPTGFSLPADIRNYFKGVSTGTDGAYVDSTMLRPLRLNRQGFVEQRDPHALKDKHGNAVLCYKCGGSALPPQADCTDSARLQWRAIIGCDFCSLHWHLDCVDPPLSSMPSMTRKWRCPAHTDEPKMRIPKNLHITPVNVPVPAPGAPLAKRPYAPVDVVPDADDKYFAQDGSGQSGKPPWEDVTVTNSSGTRVRYRIPEKTIRLEFWTKAMLDRPVPREPAPVAQVPTAPPDASELDKLVAIALRDGKPPADVPTLREPHTLAANAAAATSTLAPNARAFDGALRSSHDPQNAVSLVPGGAPDDPAYTRRNAPAPPITYLYPGEIAELRAVKQLMAAKGADKLREWLHSDS